MRLATRSCISLLAAAGFCLVFAPDAQAALKARAYGAWVHIPDYGIQNLYVCDTGWLPGIGGGNQSASEANYDVSGYLTMTQGTALSRSDDDCKGDDDFSSVTLGPTTLMSGDYAEVRFTALSGRDDDDCCNPEDDDFTAAVFTDLRFAGQPVVVTGQPNQEIIIPWAGRIVLNEVVRGPDDDCDDDNITINAMHLWPLSGGEIIVGSVTYDDDDDCCVVRSAPRTWGSLKRHYR